MNKKSPNLRLIFSAIVGTIGVLLLSLNFLGIYAGPPVANPSTVPEKLISIHFHLMERLPFFLAVLIYYPIILAFVIFLFLSPVGIFLAFKSLNSPWRKLAIFAIALNSIDLIFALFIAWLLFGLARGM
jgi:hypothetical protein